MDPGKLDQVVVIQRRATGVNALNEPTGSWVDLASVSARVLPSRTAMRFAASQAQSPVDTLVVIRWRPDVLDASHDHRLVHKARQGDIALEIDGEPVDVESKGRYLEIGCVKGVRDGR